LTSEALPHANHVRGYSTSAQLWQIPETKSPDIDIDPSRLKIRLIVGFKLQLMIERLLAVAVLIILANRLTSFRYITFQATAKRRMKLRR
jgi:hypothetical protein